MTNFWKEEMMAPRTSIDVTVQEVIAALEDKMLDAEVRLDEDTDPNIDGRQGIVYLSDVLLDIVLKKGVQ